MGGNCWSSGWLFSTVGLLLDDFWITFGWLLDYIWMTFGWLLDDFPDEGVTNSSPATGATPDPPVVGPPLLFSSFPPTNYPSTTNVFAMLLLYQLSKTCIQQQYVVLSWQDNSCSQSFPILPWALGTPSSYSHTGRTFQWWTEQFNPFWTFGFVKLSLRPDIDVTALTRAVLPLWGRWHAGATK